MVNGGKSLYTTYSKSVELMSVTRMRLTPTMWNSLFHLRTTDLASGTASQA